MSRAIKKSVQLVLFFFVVLAGAFGIGYGLQAYTGVFDVSLKIEKNTEISPNDNMTVNFSQSVSPDSYRDRISVAPFEKINLSWENDNKTLVIHPDKFWKPGTKYAVILADGRTKFLTKIKGAQIKFSVVDYPTVKSITPTLGSKDVVLDIEDPIVVDFNSSVKNFFIKFVIDPETEVAYENDPDKTQFRLLPKNKILDGQSYKIDIYAKYINDTEDGYKKIFESTFETLAPAPVNWEKDLSLRVEQAKKYTRPLMMEGKYIDINLASQTMAIFDQGKVVDAFIVSSGKRGMETPKGTYKIENKASRPLSKEYGLFMPNWMALVPDGKFGIHELPEWPGGYKEGANHLGTPVSHGCVRLGVGSAKEVYDWASIGTPVIIY